MSSTTPRRVSAALVVTALLALPAGPAVAAVHGQEPTATTLGFFEQSWRFFVDLLGTLGAVPTPTPGRHGLTSRHSDLGGFIDPDGARTQSQTQGPLVVTP
jgi:hypothetical protein